VRRQDSGDINALRYFASNDELGMTHEYMEFDGVTREFYVYEPEAVKNGTKTNVPMIIVCHGGGGSGEEFAARSGWPKLAEERNFIAVFPTGPRSGNFCAGTTWNRENVPFIKQVRDYVTENYSVDTTRCYMTGQSMGCLMSSWSAVEIPESFAAIAATDAPMHVPDTYKNDPESIDESVLMPYLFVVGTKDKYFLPGNKDYLTGNETINEYWTKRYGINENNETASKYINGPYEYVLHKTSAGVPITGMMWTRDKIHAQIPDEIRQMYDWMITFSRAEDGTLYYMGEEVVLG
jgi:poly(3-hydroxybutyrate) depolymerase